MDKRVVENAELMQDALQGLTASQKSLPSKWFYDATGSYLFEQITQLKEYYPTRTETSILTQQIGVLSAATRRTPTLVEIGSGASVKTRLLLNHLNHLCTYVPLDISAAFLKQTATQLRADFPHLDVQPVVADFMGAMPLPIDLLDTPKSVFFPGSTIGNLEQPEAIDLLARIRQWPNLGPLILGVDLVKDPETLVQAYDDSLGVTAAFNKNLLRRLNHEVGATFDLAAFDHRAIWNADHSRIEMHLVSQSDHTVFVGGTEISFAAGEHIHTENSHKYSPSGLEHLADAAGWSLNRLLTDDMHLFGVAILRPA